MKNIATVNELVKYKLDRVKQTKGYCCSKWSFCSAFMLKIHVENLCSLPSCYICCRQCCDNLLGQCCVICGIPVHVKDARMHRLVSNIVEQFKIMDRILRENFLVQESGSFSCFFSLFFKSNLDIFSMSYNCVYTNFSCFFF